ncbi:hypothetical protein OS493_003323 [Desmophyllum pertusum]|uniref:RNA-dependent RNA polymerase n=1 Tax=Desmophyllum pertusum TaxID=174260 RepID=A0A9X0A5B4_9CNID|nr:hypothetical protein OS493_003323 [Desmophyllum pertusum]
MVLDKYCQLLPSALEACSTAGTYIKHWSSDQNTSLIQDGNIQSEFEHDTKKMAITFFKEGFPEGFREVRIDMEYRQFENYVVIDEDISNGTIHFYFSLQWPPKVFEEVTNNGYTNYDRLTHFLGCSREVLGCSSVLCLSFPLQTHIQEQDEAGSPLGLMADLSSRGFFVYFAAMKTKTFLEGLQRFPRKPAFSDYKITYALECLLSRGYKISDRISRRFYDVFTKGDGQNYLLRAELVAENRVIREFGHKQQATRIAFRDEDFSKLASTYPEGLRHVLDERVVNLLTNNIEIAGRSFEFLACSNSQLRDHGAWLYDTDGEHRAADIRGSLES